MAMATDPMTAMTTTLATNISYLQKERQNVVFRTMSLVIFSVPSITNGKIQRESQVCNTKLNVFQLLYSIRAKLRDGGLDIASSYFLRCLYEKETGDLDCPEEGFLKGPLLVRVSLIKCSSYIT